MKRRASDKLSSHDKITIAISLIVFVLSAIFAYELFWRDDVTSMLVALFLMLPAGISISELIYVFHKPKNGGN